MAHPLVLNNDLQLNSLTASKPLVLTAGKVVTAASIPAADISVDDSAFSILTGTDVQTVLDEIDVALTSSASASISDLTAATGTNTIDNTSYAQEWQWNTLSSTKALVLSSTSTAAAGNNQTLFEVSLSGANANSTQTTYTTRFLNTHTGTNSTNIAGYFSASGGTNNYAGIFENGNVVIGGSTGTANALLDLQSTTKAFIGPRMTTAQKNAIGTPSAGMLVYDTDLGGYYFHNGSSWGAFGGGWGTTGTVATLTGNSSVAQAGFNISYLNGYFAIGSASESTLRGVELLQRNFTVGLASTTAATSSIIEISRNGGSTIGALSAVLDTYSLGRLNYSAYDGNSSVVGASIEAIVDGTVADDNVPTALIFKVNSGAAAPTEQFRIAPNGDFKTPLGTLGKVYVATGSVSGSTFYGCGTTPVTVIAAPGAGKYLNIVSVSVTMTYNSVAYDFAGTEIPVFIFSGASGGKYVIATALVNGTSSFNRGLQVDNGSTDYGINTPTNTAFVLTTTDAGDGTQGNSTLKYKIYYTIEDI